MQDEAARVADVGEVGEEADVLHQAQAGVVAAFQAGGEDGIGLVGGHDLLAPAGKRRRSPPPLPFKELSKFPLIVPERVHAMRRLLETQAALAGVKLDIAWEVSSVPSIIELVCAGYGHAVLTASGVAGLLSQVPGGELLDRVRSKRFLIALGVAMIAISAGILTLWPSFPLVFTAEVIHGGVSAGKRADIIQRFQNQPDPRLLVMQPQATAHGITLTAADTVVFYGPLMSVEQYIQCIARADRKGQNSDKVTVVHIEGSPIERKMFKALTAKVDDNHLLTEMFTLEINS